MEIHMRTPASIAGHPIHPMLVTIPIGLWLFSLVCDLIAMGSANAATWHTVSLYAMVGGCLGALAAAVPGLIDLLSLRGRPVQKTALKHMALNLIVLALFAINAWLRASESIGFGASLGVSLLAVVLLAMSGWLGGKMVFEGGVGVHAQDEAATVSPEAWRQERAGRAAASQAFSDRHAMAADSDRPSRERSDSPRAPSRFDSDRH
jgi:uncharacterized membrane protein